VTDPRLHQLVAKYRQLAADWHQQRSHLLLLHQPRHDPLVASVELQQVIPCWPTRLATAQPRLQCRQTLVYRTTSTFTTV